MWLRVPARMGCAYVFTQLWLNDQKAVCTWFLDDKQVCIWRGRSWITLRLTPPPMCHFEWWHQLDRQIHKHGLKCTRTQTHHSHTHTHTSAAVFILDLQVPSYTLLDELWMHYKLVIFQHAPFYLNDSLVVALCLLLFLFCLISVPHHTSPLPSLFHSSFFMQPDKSRYKKRSFMDLNLKTFFVAQEVRVGMCLSICWH